MPRILTFLKRFSAEFALRIAPAALASVIGGFLFTQYGSVPTAPAAVAQPSKAGEEMMQMVRDAHDLLVDYLRKEADARRHEVAQAQQAVEAQKAMTLAKAEAPKPVKLAQKPKLEIAKLEPAKVEPPKLAERMPPVEPLRLEPVSLETPPRTGIVNAVTSRVQAAGSGAWGLVVGAAKLPGRIWSVGEDVIGGARSPEAPPSRFTQAAM